MLVKLTPGCSCYSRLSAVPSFWTTNLEFVDIKYIFDRKVVILDNIFQANSQIKIPLILRAACTSLLVRYLFIRDSYGATQEFIEACGT